MYFFEDFIYLFWERREGRKKGRETSMCGCFWCTPYWGPDPQPRHVPWLGIEPVTLWFTGQTSIHWATPDRAFCLFVCFKDFIYLFLGRGEVREKQRERNINVWLPLVFPQLGTWPTTQPWALTGNWTSDLSVHRSALNPLSHTSQGMIKLYLKITKLIVFSWSWASSNIPCLDK